MKTIKPLLLILTSVVLAACGTTSSDSGATTAGVTGGKAAPYPLTTCIVTDNDLNSMGGSITKVYGGQEVKFCCRPCVRAYEENPAKYQSKIRG